MKETLWPKASKLRVQHRWEYVELRKYGGSILVLLGPSLHAPKKGVEKRAAVKETLMIVLTGASLKQPGTSWCLFRGQRELSFIGV